jgi:hypothetical protein
MRAACAAIGRERFMLVPRIGAGFVRCGHDARVCRGSHVCDDALRDHGRAGVEARISSAASLTVRGHRRRTYLHPALRA